MEGFIWPYSPQGWVIHFVPLCFPTQLVVLRNNLNITLDSWLVSLSWISSLVSVETTCLVERSQTIQTRALSMWISMFLSRRMFYLQSLMCLAWSMQRLKPAAVASAAAGEQQPNALCCICSVWGMGSSRLRCSTARWVWAQGTLPPVCRAAERPLSILAGLTLHIPLPTSSSASFSKQYQTSRWCTSWFTLLYNPKALYYNLNDLRHLQHILVSLGFCAWE